MVDLPDNSTVAATRPAIPAAQKAPGYYTDGDPTTVPPTPPTTLSGWQMQMLVDELCNIVNKTGAPLNRADNTQVLTALEALFLPRGTTLFGFDQKIQTPTAGQLLTHTINFTTTAPGVCFVLGSINLGAPGQQPGGCEHLLYVDAVSVGYGDNTTGPMTNFGAGTLATPGAHSVTQTYQATATAGTFASTSINLGYLFVPS